MTQESARTKVVCQQSGCLPARYILALLIFSGLTLQYTLKVNVSLAIVAMVKHPQQSENVTHNLTEYNVCPKPKIQSETQHYNGGEFDWDEEVQGHILGAYFYGYLTTQLLGGILAEKLGAKRVYGCALFVTSVLALLSPLAARFHLYAFCALRVMQGAASGVGIPTLQTMFSRWFPPVERVRLSSIVFSAIYLGSLLSMSLSGLLAEIGGWPLIFYFFGGASLAWLVPWLLLAYDSPEIHPHISDVERSYILEGFGRNASKETEKPPPTPWLSIFTSLPIWAAITMHFGVTWVLNTFLSEMPTYTKNVLHFDIKHSGFISALPYLANLLSSIFFGFFSQWLRVKGYVSHLTAYRLFNGIAAIGSAIALFVITLVGCDTVSIVILLITTMALRGAFFGGSYVNHMDLAVNFTGTISGILHTIINLSGIISPWVTGMLTKGQQTQDQWRIVFYISIVVVLVPYSIYLGCGSVDEQPWNNPSEEHSKKNKDQLNQSTHL